jgi:hypothetical protein
MISDEIIKVLDDLCERFGIVIDWTSENVVPQLTVLCEKLITYLTVTNGIWVAVGVSVIVCMVLLIKYCYKEYMKCLDTERDNILWEYYSGVEPTIIGFILMLFWSILFAVTVGIIIVKVNSLLKLLIIPELYLLEYFSNYMG